MKIKSILWGLIGLTIIVLFSFTIFQPYSPGVTNYGEMFSGRSALSLLHNFVGSNIILNFLPAILVLLCAFFYYKIVELFDRKTSVYALFFFVVSPIFARLSIVSSSFLLSLTFFLSGFYFLFRKRKVVGYILLSLIPWISILDTVVLFFVFAYYFSHKKHEKKEIIYSVILLIVAILFHLNNYFIYGMLPNLSLSLAFVSDFGSFLGFSLFAIILALYSLFFNNNKNLTLAILIGLFASLFFGNDVNIYTNLFIAYLAGSAFRTLLNLNWTHKVIKILTAVAIICGVFLSLITYVETIPVPSKELIESFDILENATVLSAEYNGFWIQYFSGQKTIVDSYSNDLMLNKTYTLFYNRNLKNATFALDELNVTHILIDSRMREEIWKRDDDGILFLLNSFDKIFTNDEVDIWKIK